MGVKIVTIGGGSSYTPELAEGLINRANLIEIDEWVLVDVEEGREKAEIILPMMQRMFKKANLKTKVSLTFDRREALKGADYVTTQFRVGLLPARAKDERIPNSHGQLGQETNGAGGLLKALRTVPVVLDIVEEVKELCPGAWIINFTNPAGIVTEAVNKYGNYDRFIGVCNVPIGIKMAIAKELKLDIKKLHVDFMGLNHFVYATKVTYEEKDITDEVLAKMGKFSMANIEARNIEQTFVESLKALPCPYHRYFFMKDYMVKEQLEKYKEGKTRAEEVMRTEAELFELYKDPNLDHKPEQLSKRGGAHYSDVACDVITSIHADLGLEHAVIIPNNGAIPNLDQGDAVEITCKITKDGAVPALIDPVMPLALRGQIQIMKSFEILAAEAAVEGSYEKALVALNINPLSLDDASNKIILDELLEAHKEYLPRFK